jgi:hypothetical protein
VSPLDRQAPPAGEEIHLPGGSLQPLILAAAITVTLIGVTTSIFMVIAGGIATVVTILLWIRDTRRDVAELPLEHEQH